MATTNPDNAPVVTEFAGTFAVLGEIIRSRRAELGLSIFQLAEKAQVGTRFVWDLEHGQARQETRKVDAVTEALRLRLLGRPTRAIGPWAEALEPYSSNELPGDEQRTDRVA